MRRSRSGNLLTEIVLIATLGGLGLWMVHLALDLPSTYRAENWDIAWVGFDAVMFFSIAITAWGMIKHHPISIVAAIVTATLLVVDCWFDMNTSQEGLDFRSALIAGLIFQLPLAIALIRFSMRETKAHYIRRET